MLLSDNDTLVFEKVNEAWLSLTLLEFFFCYSII
jgi:hypothetical protein